MTLSKLLNLPCQIERRSLSASTDRYGNPLTARTTVDTVCELQQKRRDEPNDAGELSDTWWACFLPAGTAIDTTDVVVANGHIFEVVGDPWQARNPRTQTFSHVECTLRRTGPEAGS